MIREYTLYDVSVWVLPLVIAITFHEAAHGFVAHHFGDNTAWERGRVSFNPLKHIDPFGTLIMPAILLLSHSPFLFGYAKPVPVNFRALRNPRIDMVWVALAGPATNIALALVAAAAFHLLAFAARECGAMDCRQPQKRACHQCRAGDFQHAPDPAAGRRPGRGRAAAQCAGGAAFPAGTVWDADPDRNSDPAADGSVRQLGLNLDVISAILRTVTGYVIRLLLVVTGNA